MTLDIMYDYDDIVVGMVPALHRKAHELGLHDNTQEALATWQGHIQYGCAEDDWWRVFDELMAEGWYYNTPAEPGIVEDMHRLKAAGHRIHILTARGFMKHAEEIRKATYKNIEFNQLPVDTVTFDRDKVNGMITALGGWEAPDARPSFDFAIDDGPHNYVDLKKAGINVWLRELPHNQEFRNDNPWVHSVPDVHTFVDMILKES